MNKNKYAESQELENRRLLLKIYHKQSFKLKKLIYEATEKGNDTKYLESLHTQVENEIIVFEKLLKQYSAKSAKDSYNAGGKLAFAGTSAQVATSQYAFGMANREAIQALAITTYKPLSKMAQHIGRATLEYMQRENFESTQSVLKALGKLADSEFLRKTGIEGIADVAVGSSSWQKAAREIRDKIIQEADFKVPYYKKDGSLSRFVSAQDYAKLVARTTTAHTLRQGAKDRILDNFDGEFDLVMILGRSTFPNSPCIPFEGKILSLEGIVKGYPTIAEAEAEGLFHVNCIHSFGVTDEVMEIYNKGEYETKPTEEKEEFENAQNKSSLETEKFKSASTIEEATEFTKSYMKNGTMPTFNADITLENLNTFNEQMNYLTTKYGVNNIDQIGTFIDRKKSTYMHANAHKIEISNWFSKYTKTDFHKAYIDDIINYKSDLLYKKTMYEKMYLNNPKYSQKKVKEQVAEMNEALKFDRFSVRSDKNFFKDTITHEFGHVLQDSYKGSFGFKVHNAYLAARRNGDIYKISKYADTSYKEFFAECFVIYENGEPLPQYIKEAIEEVIKR